MKKLLVACISAFALVGCGSAGESEPITVTETEYVDREITTTLTTTVTEEPTQEATPTEEAAPEPEAAPAPAAAPAEDANADADMNQRQAFFGGAPAADPAPAASGPFPNCAAARAAGAAPVYAGTPGYGTHLDRDGDGVGCES